MKMNRLVDIFLMTTMAILMIPLLPILMPYWWVEEIIQEKRREKEENYVKNYSPLPDGEYIDDYANKYIVRCNQIVAIIDKSIIRDQKINEILK